MATEVFTSVEIKLQDGTEVTLRPLPLSRQRKFMRRWTEHMAYISEQRDKDEDARDDDMLVADKQFDVFVDLACLCLESVARNGKPDEEYKAYIEDVLDEPTLYFVLEKCGGLELNTPNPQAQALAQEMSQAAGTN